MVEFPVAPTLIWAVEAVIVKSAETFTMILVEFVIVMVPLVKVPVTFREKAPGGDGPKVHVPVAGVEEVTVTVFPERVGQENASFGSLAVVVIVTLPLNPSDP